MATTTNEGEELVRHTIDALDDRDRGAFVAANREDVVLHHPRETYRGIDEVIDFRWGIFDAFPDLTFSVEEVVTEGETIAARWTVAGTHEGEFEGVPPTGEEVEMYVIPMTRVEDGGIAEVWLQPDELGLLRQLGVAEPSRL